MPSDNEKAPQRRLLVELVDKRDGKESGKGARITLASILSLLQALAILASGCWIVFQFVTFQREANKLTLRQQELAAKQAQFTLQAQQAAEKANLAQARLAAEQAEFTLRTQESQKELREKELAYSVRAKELENEANQLTIASKKTYRTSRSSRMTVREVGSGLYDVALDPGIRNTSDAQFEVSLIVVDLYIGKIDLDNTSSGASAASPLTFGTAQTPASSAPVLPPPSRWSNFGELHGGIQWIRTGTVASVYTDAVGHFKKGFIQSIVDAESEEGNLVQYGPGTGTWKPGETVEFAPRFLIRAQPEDYVAFSVHLCINRAQKDEDLWWFDEYGSIADLVRTTVGEKQK